MVWVSDCFQVRVMLRISAALLQDSSRSGQAHILVISLHIASQVPRHAV